MTKLIRADLARMFKTKSFWICGIISVVSVFGNFLLRYLNNKEIIETLGIRLFADSSNIVLFASIFVSLYLGTDYSNGTIRNKMTVGNGRCSIYFSNLIVSSSAGILYASMSRLPVLLFGLFAGGKLGMGSGEFQLRILVMLLSMIAASSLFTLAGTLISSRSTNVVITLIGVFVLITGMAVLLEFLQAPEYVSPGYTITIDGLFQPLEPELNPHYIRGGMRVFLQTLCDIVPMGQAMELEMGIVGNSGLLLLYSAGFTAAVSAAGAAVFGRKDLK